MQSTRHSTSITSLLWTSPYQVQERKYTLLFGTFSLLQKWVANWDMSRKTTSLLLSSILVQERKHTLSSWVGCTLHIPGIRPFWSPISVSLTFSFKREKPLPGNSRNEWQIEIWVPTILAHLHRTHRLLFAHIFSLDLSFKRENYTHAIIPPSWELQKWVANWDMSRKSF